MTVYATDEDIALRASTDFVGALSPRIRCSRRGRTASFGASDPWTLDVDLGRLRRVSASCRDSWPGLTKPTTSFGANGELFAIQTSVSTGAITLRRKGQAKAWASRRPPGRPDRRRVRRQDARPPDRPGELRPRSAGSASTNAIAGRRSVDLYDPQQLREAVVLTVLYKQYLDQSRQFAGSDRRPVGDPRRRLRGQGPDRQGRT